jgi:Virulence protein
MEKDSFQYQLYMLDDENEINALVKDETIWLTQKSMSELFGVGVPAINKHLSNIFESGELEENSTLSKMEIVQQEGSKSIKTEIVFTASKGVKKDE